MELGDSIEVLDDADAAVLDEAIECGRSSGDECHDIESAQSDQVEFAESGISWSSSSSSDGALSIDDVADEGAAKESDGGNSEMGAGDWRPGHNCGRWVSRAHGLQEQGRVVVVNVALALQKTSEPVRRALAESFQLRGRSWAVIAARLIGVSASMVRDVARRVHGKGFWDPQVGVDQNNTKAPSAGSAAPPGAGSAGPPRAGSAAPAQGFSTHCKAQMPPARLIQNSEKLWGKL